MEGAEYSVSLADQMSGPAQEAANALNKLVTAMGGASAGITKLGGEQTKVINPTEIMRDAFHEAGAGIREFANSIKEGDLGGAVKGLGESLAGVATALDLIAPGLGQAASAAIKATSAFAGFTVGLIQSGVEMSIEATQGKQAMISMFDALGNGKDKGEGVEKMLDGLSDQIGITKNKLAPMTAAFMSMGIHGEEALKKVTLAAASAKAIKGDAGASSFEMLTRKIQAAAQTGEGLKIPIKGLGSLADAGLEVADVASKMGVSEHTLAEKLKAGTVNAKQFGDAMQEAMITKGAGPLAVLGRSFDSVKSMLGQNFEKMFEDMGKAVDPFMGQMKDMMKIFSQDTASGQVMKSAITKGFSSIIAMATKALPMIKHMFQYMIIYSLRAYIFLKEHWTTVSTVLKGFGIAAIAVVTVLAALAAPMILGAAAAGVLITALGYVVAKLSELETAAETWGSSLVDGLIKGITGKIEDVKKAAADLAKAASSGVKNFLGIHSPSKLMVSFGKHTAGGLAAGIKGGATAVGEAGATLGGHAAGAIGKTLSGRDISAGVASATAPATPAGGAGGGANINVGGITITAPQGVTNAAQLTEVAASLLFERLALQQGL